MTTIRNEMHYRFPFPRRFLTQAVRKILSDQPRVFAFDLVLTGDSENKEDDANLSALLGGNNNIVLFTYLQTNNQIYRIPESYQATNLDVGIINKLRGPDNIVRSVLPVVFDLKEMRHYFCAEALLAMKYWNIPSKALEQDVVNNRILFQGKTLPLRSAYYGQEKRLDYKCYYSAKDMKKVSFCDVYFNKTPPGFFKDKIVLLGTESLIRHDFHNTPLGIQIGIAIVANTLLTFLNNAFPEPLPLFALDLLYLLPVLLFFSFLSKYPPPFRNLLWAASFLVLIWAGDYLLFQNNVLYDGAIPFFTIFFFTVSQELVFYAQLFIENRKI